MWFYKYNTNVIKLFENLSMWGFFSFPPSVINLEMRSDGFWVLANINVTGYYRVNYDLGNWERLFTQLNTNHKVHRHSLT